LEVKRSGGRSHASCGSSADSCQIALEVLLKAHEPYPALVVDGHWDIVVANRALGLLLEDVDPELLRSPASALRISLHPRGLAPNIVNFAEWRRHLLDRLRRQFRIVRDPVLDERAAQQPN